MNRSAAYRRWLFAALALTLAVLAAVGGAQVHSHTSAAGKTPASAQVTSTLVQARDMPIYRSGVGNVTAAQTVTVRTRVDGALESVAFTEGQDVRAGQLLAKIDARALRAQLDEAKAQKARDEAALADARVDLRRYTDLVAKDAAPGQQLDTQAALVRQLEAAVQTDAAQVSYAQVQVAYTTITAPIGGRVGARLVDPGNIVHAADSNGLLVINQIDPITVVFTLPGDAVPEIIAAQRGNHTPLAVEVFAPASDEPLVSGKLVLMNNQIDTGSGTITLKARFANPAHKLWPGQYVDVRLVLGQRKQALTVPAPAVQRGVQGTYVYVVEASDTVRMQPVDVAQIQGGLAIIAKGLAAGERVVVDGQYKLSPGAAVAEPAAASGPAGGTKASR